MKKKWIKLGIILLLLGLLVCYLDYENNQLQVSRYVVVSDRLPHEFNHYQIVQISDFHNTKSKRLTRSLVENLKKIKPDIIVLTGDLIDAFKLNINTAIFFIEQIKEIAPIYFVAGNHEAMMKDYERLEYELLKNNVTILDDKVSILHQQEAEINLVGISDPEFNYNTYRDDETIVKDSIQMISYDSSKFSILLSHRPELFDTYVEEKFDLVLAGHAHGGQIRLPLIGGLIAPDQGFFPKYTSGEFHQKETTMIISRGIGNSILPFRINNRPELVVIELQDK